MSDKKRVPKVRLSKPGERKIAQGRKIELRYTDLETGKEVRISTGTLDENEALEQKRTLEAKLLLGIDGKPKKLKGGPSMEWGEFRQWYDDMQLTTLRRRSADFANSQLDIAERILQPRKLSDVASSEALHDLQRRLLAGEESTVGPKHNKRQRGPRSPITVRNYMATVLAALHWAEYMGWLPAVPKLRKLKVAKLRQMKGRPITGEEFDRMLGKVKETVGTEAETSWKYLLRGLWESGLRLDELMHVHWSDASYIVPQWTHGALPTLAIPSPMQKNDTEESIPLLPGFEALLLETKKLERFGWVFNPMSLQTKLGRRARFQRSDAEWVGKVITRVGKAAGVVVRPAVGGKSAKFASAHDLRRSCAERLISSGVPEREVSRMLRHASIETTRKHYAPGTVQQSAGVIRNYLALASSRNDS